MSTDNDIKSSKSQRTKSKTSSTSLEPANTGSGRSLKVRSCHESGNRSSSRLQRTKVLEKQVSLNIDSDTDSSTSQITMKSDSKLYNGKTSRRLPEMSDIYDSVNNGKHSRRLPEMNDIFNDNDNNSRRGRRTAYESSQQRSDRRAIANKIRSKKLVAGQNGASQGSLSTYTGQDDDDASCSSAASRASSRSTRSTTCSTTSPSKRSSSSHKNSSKKRNNTTGTDIKPAQFSVASLLSETEANDEEFQDSISLFSCGPNDLNMSSSYLNRSSRGSLDADNENSEYHNSFNNLKLDGIEPNTPKIRKSKMTRQSSLEMENTTSLTRNASSSSSLKQLNMSLGELFDKEKSKDKNSKKKNGERSVMGITIGSRKPEPRIKDRRTDNNYKSCIKGKNNRRYIGKKNEKKSISFETSNLEQVRTVKAFFRYSKELYLSEEEIDNFRIKQASLTEATTKEINDVQTYMNAYRTGRQQIKYGQMSTEIYQDLIIGIKQGHYGIEGQSTIHESIASHIKETTRSIVMAYQNALNAQQTKIKKKTLDASFMVKAHSEAITETDRHWAVAMGNAVMHASKD